MFIKFALCGETPDPGDDNKCNRTGLVPCWWANVLKWIGRK
jgi:hypothetical protein